MLLKKQDQYKNYLQGLLDMRHDTQDINLYNLSVFESILFWKYLLLGSITLHKFLAL